MEKYNLSFTYTDYTLFFENFGKKKIKKKHSSKIILIIGHLLEIRLSIPPL